MKRKTVITILQLILFVGLGIFLIYWKAGQMSAEQKHQVFVSLRSIRPWYLVPVFIAGFFSHFFRALRWKLLLEPLDIRPSTANTFFAVLIGYLVNAVLPRIGEIAKCTVLAKYEKVPADKMVGTIVAERAFDLVNLIILIVLGILVQASVIGNHLSLFFRGMHGGGGHSLWYILTGLIIIIVLFLLFYQRIKRTRIGRAIKGIGDGVRTIFHLKHRRLFIIYTILIWLSYLSMIVLGFYGLPATEGLPVLASLIVLGFGAIGMILTPGGFGAYPIIVADILVVYGISKPAALAFGWVSWSAQTGVIVILGLLSLILLPIYNRTEHNAQAGLDTTQDT